MSSSITPQSIKNLPQLQLTVTLESSTETTATYKWIVEYVCASVSDDWYYMANYTLTTPITSYSYRQNISNTGTHTSQEGTCTVERGTSSKNIEFRCDAMWYKMATGTSTPDWSSPDAWNDTSLIFDLPARASYVISYDANGGTGVPNSQTKFHGIDIVIPDTIPTKSGLSFASWSATLDDGSTVYYSPSDILDVNQNVTLTAVWERVGYTITYDANGGTGGPTTSTKYHDLYLTLSSDTPTRMLYGFKGWGVSPNSTTVSYNPGDIFKINSDYTLYAIWEYNYTRPIITDIKAIRCDASGTASDEGTYANIVFNWESMYDIDYIEITTKTPSGEVVGTVVLSASTGVISGRSGNIDAIIGDGNLSNEVPYEFLIRIEDEGGLGGDLYNTNTLSTAIYTIDCYPSRKSGISFGGPAITEGVADFYYKINLRDEIQGFAYIPDGIRTSSLTVDSDIESNGALIVKSIQAESIQTDHLDDASSGLALYESAGIDPDTTLDSLILTHLNTPNGTFMYIQTYFYASKTVTSNRFQIAYPYNKKDGVYYRYYYGSSGWSSWLSINYHNLTSNERFTGKYYLDKPIYSQCIAQTMVETEVVHSDVCINSISPIENLDVVLDIRGTICRSTGGSHIPLNFYGSSSNYNRTWVTSSGEVMIRTSTPGTVYAIVEYTKTTD